MTRAAALVVVTATLIAACESTITPIYPDVAVVSGKKIETFFGEMNAQAVIDLFYESYPDRFDFLVIFTVDTIGLFQNDGSNAPHYIAFKNDILGIGQQIFPRSPDARDPKLLEGIIFMGSIARWLDRPGGPVSDDGLSVLAHMLAHRWGVFVGYGADDSALLRDDDGVHWSPLALTGASPLGGFEWRDNLDGSFTAISRWTGLYNPFDLYLMGLLAPENVPAMNLIDASAGLDKSSLSIGSTITGNITELALDSVIVAEGKRFPPAGSSQTNFRVAFALVTIKAFDATGNDVKAVDTFRKKWSDYFAFLTGDRASMATTLWE